MKTVTKYYGHYIFQDEKGYFLSENGKRYKYFKCVKNLIDKLTH